MRIIILQLWGERVQEVNDQNTDATPTSENILKDEDEDDLPF